VRVGVNYVNYKLDGLLFGRQVAARDRALSCPGRTAACNDAVQTRDPSLFFTTDAWTPDLRSVTSCRSASGEQQQQVGGIPSRCSYAVRTKRTFMNVIRSTDALAPITREQFRRRRQALAKRCADQGLAGAIAIGRQDTASTRAGTARPASVVGTWQRGGWERGVQSRT
jgi:hypothetical protein